MGSNYTVGVSKSVKIEGQAIKLALVYASFNSDDKDVYKDERIYLQQQNIHFR